VEAQRGDFMNLPERNSKKLMLEILRDQPDNSSFDELLRVLAFHRLVIRGEHDVDQGRMVSTEELKNRFKSWRT
jgi:hypothetical protein